MPDFHIEQSDAFALLERIEDRSLGLIFTDPPWATPTRSPISRYAKSGGTASRAKDLRADYEEFTANFDWSRLIEEANRLLVEGGHLLLWCGWHNVSHVVDDCNRILGFGRTSVIARIIPNPAPRVRGMRLDPESGKKIGGGLVSSWDCIVVSRRASDGGDRVNLGSFQERRNVRIIGDDAIESANPRGARGAVRHPAAKPDLLCRELIRNFSAPGDVVCDPCCGGGSIPAAALAEGRDALGCDLDSAWVEAAKAKCAEALRNE